MHVFLRTSTIALRRCCAALAISVHLSGIAVAQIERLPDPASEMRPAVNEAWFTQQQWGDQIIHRGTAIDEVSPHNADTGRVQEVWRWHVLPAGMIYRAYLAGEKESRMAGYWNWEQDEGALWDITLGGRAALLRYGTFDPILPHGFEVQIEGAAFPRLDPDRNHDLTYADFRFGVPLVYSHGPWELKLAYYHLSSHVGDEQMIHNNSLFRINYVRDAIVWGMAYRWTPDLRLYGETAWAFNADGGAKPWEFQFGAEFSPLAPTGIRPVPFWALNGHLRQEHNYSGNLVAQIGLQWRSAATGARLRTGFEYYNGKSRQWEIFNTFEQQAGIGLWYDF